MREQRIFIRLSLVACIIGLLIFCIYIYAAGCPKHDLTTVSPNLTYKIHLKEQTNISHKPFNGQDNHQVVFSVLKNGEQIIENEDLYGGDIYDDRFTVLFPEHEWIADSVIRFGNKNSPSSTQHDEISISNSTEKVIAYLRVRAGKGEMFLLFDLQPKSVIRLNTKPQTDRGEDLSWVDCKGKFNDGERISEEGANFKVRGKYQGTAHYCISINNNGLDIKSQEFEGFKSSVSGAETEIPKAANCGYAAKTN
jgi:hypothetical protein